MPCSSSTAERKSDETDEAEEKCVKAKNLLFAHQTTWQRHLMNRYGHEITLDATHKTMRYDLLLFFLAKTNVNYAVLGSFMIQRESTASIQGTVGIFHDWNDSWKPSYFMTDFCQEEINAIENTFLGRNDSEWFQGIGFICIPGLAWGEWFFGVKVHKNKAHGGKNLKKL